MKKAVITFAAVAALTMAAATTASAAAGISLEDAKKKALEAVNVTEDQVIFKPDETDLDDGREVYEVDFFVPGEIKYEFDIDVATGAITDQSIDLWEADDDLEYADLIKAAAAKASGLETEVMEAIEGEITELQAKMIALVDAGFNTDEVTITKCRRDQDDGVWQFEVELRTADGTEYEYELKASDGSIMDKDIDQPYDD